MKNNPEFIPTEIFDWLEHHSFEALNMSSQAIVLAHFSKDEYERMHKAASGLHSLAYKSRPRGKEAIKENLRLAFDQKYPQSKSWTPSILKKPIQLGQVAAIGLLLSAGLVFQYYKLNNPQILTRVEHHTDTLVVESSPTPLLIYDTVYLKKGKDKPQQKLPISISSNQPRTFDSEMHIIGADDLESPANQPKRNSLQDDTLAYKIGFVSM